ncbi:MAG: phosphomannomutase/phosphoglucomutase, partial [Gemmatimonadales bacterium]
ALAAALRAGMVEAGATAIDVGVLPTPALYLGVAGLGTDGGVQVTGSHNPPEFNGFKLVLGGEAFHGDEILGLWEIIVAERWRSGAGRETSDGSVLGRYRDGIVSRHRLARPVRVVVDCGNGAGSLVAVGTLEALGAEVTPLFCESDGTFPNHHPDPTVPENLRDLQAGVRRTGAELGLAFDGDADRIGGVDESGRIVYGDQLLVILGRDAVARFGPGTPVIFDVKCSEVLPAALAEAGARPIMWKTGHSLIKAKMKEEHAPLAGEMSGHMFFGGDYLGFDDALFAAARLLEIVSRGPFGLASLLSDLPATIATPEIRVDVPEERKFDLVERAVAHFSSRYPVNTIDGARITFPHGWGLLRASNTQPILVLRFEASDQPSLDAARGEVVGWLAGQGVQA